MRIAIATDRDCVAPGFGCCPFCTIVDIEDGRVHSSLLIPNPGAKHEYWADLFFRNSIRVVIAGSMGASARAILTGAGIRPVLGVRGSVTEAIERYLAGDLGHTAAEPDEPAPGEGCCHGLH